MKTFVSHTSTVSLKTEFSPAGSAAFGNFSALAVGAFTVILADTGVWVAPAKNTLVPVAAMLKDRAPKLIARRDALKGHPLEAEVVAAINAELSL